MSEPYPMEPAGNRSTGPLSLAGPRLAMLQSDTANIKHFKADPVDHHGHFPHEASHKLEYPLVN